MDGSATPAGAGATTEAVGGLTADQGHGGHDAGYVMALIGFLMVPLMLFAALGVDVAAWYQRTTNMQKAVDAAALAGTVWMPNYGNASGAAASALKDNGINVACSSTVGSISVSCTFPSDTRITVCITDTAGPRFFGAIVDHHQTLKRCATAEYFLPLPLGSPLNYFGGTYNTSLTTTNVVTQNTTPDTQTSCDNGSCYVSTDPPVATGGGGSGMATCKISGSSRWYQYSSGVWTYKSSGTAPGGIPTCLWYKTATTPNRSGDTYANENPVEPYNANCKVSGVSRYWRFSGGVWTYVTSWNTGSMGATPTATCYFAQYGSTTTPVSSDPIDPSRSPNFWAYIEGPGTNATNGDAYSPYCYGTVDCGINPSGGSSSRNRQSDYSTALSASDGYWYVIKPSATGPVDVQVFDASYDCNGTTPVYAGDRHLNGGSCSGAQLFHTVYQLYKLTDPLDRSTAVAVSGCSWDLAGGTSLDVTYGAKWVSLCSQSMAAGSEYLLNVRTYSSSTGVGTGANGYAVQGLAGGSYTAGGQPAVYALDNMAMYNNVTVSSTSSTSSTFYLAEVGPQYAGKYLDIKLWDPGDVSGADADLFVEKPNGSGGFTDITASPSACTYYVAPDPNVATSSGNSDPTSASIASQASQATANDGGKCGFQSSKFGGNNSGSGDYRNANGEWVNFRMLIPSDYTCTVGVGVGAGNCWWGIKYVFGAGAQPTDVTTWQARVEGNPVHLVQ